MYFNLTYNFHFKVKVIDSSLERTLPINLPDPGSRHSLTLCCYGDDYQQHKHSNLVQINTTKRSDTKDDYIYTLEEIQTLSPSIRIRAYWSIKDKQS